MASSCQAVAANGTRYARRLPRRLRRDVVTNVTMGMTEIVWQFANGQIRDVVGASTAGRAVQACELAHPERNRMIRAGRVAANAQSADHLAARVERDTAAKRDNAARDFPQTGSLLLEVRIERIGVVQTVQ